MKSTDENSALFRFFEEMRKPMLTVVLKVSIWLTNDMKTQLKFQLNIHFNLIMW